MSHLERSMVGGLFHPQGWRKTIGNGWDTYWKKNLVPGGGGPVAFQKNLLFLTLELGILLPRFDLHMFFFQMVFFSHPRFVDDYPVPFP